MYRVLVLFIFALLAACTPEAQPVVTPVPTSTTSISLPTITVPALTATKTSSSATAVAWRIKEVFPWRLTLNEYTITEARIFKVDLTAESLAKEQMQFSSLMQISLRNRDGHNLDRTLEDCGLTLDGIVLPGGKLSGELCWKGAQMPVMLLFQANRGETAVYWVIGE